MAPDEILERLTQVADKAIEQEGFTASRSCRYHLVNKISHMTVRITSRLLRNPDWIEELHFAEKLTAQLVHEMATEGRNKGYRVLPPDTFFRALERLGSVALLSEGRSVQRAPDPFVDAFRQAQGTTA